VPRLAILTASELTRDPRARRQVSAARRLGFDVVGRRAALAPWEIARAVLRA
jgi:hypothetical protein